MELHLLLAIILDVFAVHIVSKIYEINTPFDLKSCFEQKRFNLNYSYWDNSHAYCIQKNNWRMLKTSWSNITIETENWIDELLRMSEYDFVTTRHKRQSTRTQKPLRIRREYRLLSDRERYHFHSAINMLKADTTVRPNRFDALGLLHQRLVDDVHHGAAFLPFHRVLLVVFENALRQKIPSLVLPYWDSRLDNVLQDPTRSIMWSTSFMGTVTGQVRTGPFRNWDTPAGPLIRNGGQDGELLDHSTVRAILTRSKLQEISEPKAVPPFDFEIRHGDVHQWIGGLMEPAETAGFDPVFYLHHAFVDYVWELFRRNQIRQGINPETDYPSEFGPESQAPNKPMRLGRLRNMHGLSNIYTSRIYTYQPSPTCSFTDANCGSNYLRCDVRFGHPRCVSVEVIGRRQNLHRLQRQPRRRKRRQAFNDTILSDTNDNVMISPVNDICPVTTSYNVIQNSYLMNGISDSRVWVYIPVKIIYKRQPTQGKYNSFRIIGGKLRTTYDIYDPHGYSGLSYLFPPQEQLRTCSEMDSIFTKVSIHSDGLNYHGSYRDFAILDARQPFDSTIMFMAVKSPQMRYTDVVLTAYTHCGTTCNAYCKTYYGDFKQCDGALKVTNENPKYYGSDYGSAVRLLWTTNGPENIPSLDESNIFVKFVCA